MQQVGTGFDKIVVEHKEHRTLTAALRTFLSAPRPEIGTPGAHTWATDLAEQLLRFHDKMFRHYRHEESSGPLEEIVKEKPPTAAAVEVVSFSDI